MGESDEPSSEQQDAGQENASGGIDGVASGDSEDIMNREEAQRLLQRVRDREKARREAREELAARGRAPSTGRDW